jgi:hypothetical protein
LTKKTTLLLLEVVDIRSRMLAFRGACGEPPRLIKPVRVSPIPLLPQESRTFRSNQLVEEASSKKPLKAKQQSYRNELKLIRITSDIISDRNVFH